MPKLTAKGRSSATEVDAYAYIRERLKDFGWNIKNPSRHPMGQVWTQNQCLTDLGIKERLGAKHPENIIKISETKLWVIEAKANRKDLELALSEAIDYYSERILHEVLQCDSPSGYSEGS
jgi:type I restriction enzyme M protein